MKVEKIVQFALLNNPIITNVVAKTAEGHPLISLSHNPGGKYPLIELHATGGRDLQHADDHIYSMYSRVEVNFHCKGEEYGVVSEEMNKTLRGLGFVRINYYSTRNPYTNVTEYTNVYRASLSNAMINHAYYQQKQQLEFPEQQLPKGEYFDDATNAKYELLDGGHINPNRFWGNQNKKE